MKTGTARYAKHYEIAAYGESAVRCGYNHWWSKAFLIGFSANTFNNLGRTTESDVISGWGMASSIHDVINSKTRTDNRCRSGADVPTGDHELPHRCTSSRQQFLRNNSIPFLSRPRLFRQTAKRACRQHTDDQEPAVTARASSSLLRQKGMESAGASQRGQRINGETVRTEKTSLLAKCGFMRRPVFLATLLMLAFPSLNLKAVTWAPSFPVSGKNCTQANHELNTDSGTFQARFHSGLCACAGFVTGTVTLAKS